MLVRPVYTESPQVTPRGSGPDFAFGPRPLSRVDLFRWDDPSPPDPSAVSAVPASPIPPPNPAPPARPPTVRSGEVGRVPSRRGRDRPGGGGGGRGGAERVRKSRRVSGRVPGSGPPCRDTSRVGTGRGGRINLDRPTGPRTHGAFRPAWRFTGEAAGGSHGAPGRMRSV
jgi:hypothetical protein